VSTRNTWLTVYRHFPDEEALFGACSSHWESLQRLPDPPSWMRVEDPIERLRMALTDLYRFYQDGERMLTLIHRDRAHVPPGRRKQTEARAEAMRALLLQGLGTYPRLPAVVGHAMSFPAWTSLCRDHGLSNQDAVELMVRLVEVTSRRP
jgi:AcrR family transcriptional regulator